MAELILKAEKQLLTIQNQEIIASGDNNVDRCIFEFSDDWTDYTKTGVFYQSKTNVQYAVLESDNTCFIPSAAMAKGGRMYIGVFGIKDTSVMTSTLVTIDIRDGAISGDNVSTEPTDDVFLAIIAQYQKVAELMQTYKDDAEELRKNVTELTENIEIDYDAFKNSVNQALEDQNEFLNTLGAFDLTELETRMSNMELTLAGYGETIKAEHAMLDEKMQNIENSAFLIKNVMVSFDDNNEFILNDSRVTESSIANAYFDAISVATASGHAIYIETFNGYIKFTTTTVFQEPLNCTVEIRRY